MLNTSPAIYAIADHTTCRNFHVDILDFISALKNAGVKIIQYRNKTSKPDEVKQIFENLVKNFSNDMILVINDYPSLADHFKTRVHLGQTDENSKSIQPFGRSTHSLAEVKNALEESPQPEYIGFGAMYSSKTKPEITANFHLLDDVLNLWKNEIVLIGGIGLNNVHLLPRDERIYYAILSDFFSEGNRLTQIESRAKKILNKLL